MSEEVAKDNPSSDVPELPMRPTLDSAENLPEPWIRLEMARARANPEKKPHSRLGLIALGMASGATVAILIEMPFAWGKLREMETIRRAGPRLGDLELFKAVTYYDSRLLGYSLLGLGLSFCLGFFSLFFRNNRKTTGILAMGVALGAAILLAIFEGLFISNLSISMSGK